MNDSPDMTIHDVWRGLVRGFPNTEANQRRALDMIDAHQKGFETLGEYHEELAKQREHLANQPAAAEPQSAEDRMARLEAQNARLEALLNAQTGTTARPAPPAPATDSPTE
jgi:hypothetical protein